MQNPEPSTVYNKGLKYYGGGNNKSVYFLNDHSGIKKFDNGDNHVPSYYKYDDFTKYHISDNRMRWTDFYGVDLFDSWKNNISNRPERFGNDSIGQLPEMEYEYFKNLEFNFNVSAIFKKSQYSSNLENTIFSLTGSNIDKQQIIENQNGYEWRKNKNPHSLVGGDLYGGTWMGHESTRMNQLPRFSDQNHIQNFSPVGTFQNYIDLDHLNQQMINQYQEQFKGQKLYTKVSSYKIFVPYWLNSGTDTHSFDVNETFIIPLSAKLNLYVSNESQFQMLNDVDNALTSNSFFTNSKLFVTDDGAISLDPSKYNDRSLVRPSIGSNDKPVTTYQQYMNWQNNSWENLKKSLSKYNFDNGLLKLNFQIFLNSEAKLNSRFKKGKLYLSVKSNETKSYYFIKTIDFGFHNSEKYQNWIDTISINDRLTITPSNWFRYDNGKYIYGED